MRIKVERMRIGLGPLPGTLSDNSVEHRLISAGSVQGTCTCQASHQPIPNLFRLGAYRALTLAETETETETGTETGTETDVNVMIIDD